MEGFPNSQPKKESTNKELYADARAKLAQNTLPDSEQTIAEATQADRDALAAELRGIRRARDTSRERSSTLAARAKDMLGMRNGSRALATEADTLHTDAQHALDNGKSRIQHRENEAIRNEIESSVLQPLQALHAGDEELAQRLASFSEENFRSALHTYEAGNIQRTLAYALQYAGRERNAHTHALARIALEEELKRPEVRLERLQDYKYLQEEIVMLLDDEHFAQLMQRMEQNPEFLKKMLARWNVPIITRYVTQGGEGALATVTGLMEDHVEHGEEEFLRRFLVKYNADPALYERAKDLFDGYLQKNFGIAFVDIDGRWELGQGYFDMRSNLNAMWELEEALPGSVRRLRHDYGIAEFGRYPREVLVTQLEEEDVQQPYGIVMFPQEDHNGAFDKDAEVLKKLYDQTRGRYGLKIFEVDGMYAVARDLVGLDKRYGKEHKIAFAVIGGHGQEGMIHFGNFYSSGSIDARILEKEDMDGKGVQRTAAFFEPNPAIVLVSCSTGAESGIGQRISEVLQAEVIAPKRPTSLRDIETTYGPDGRPHFDVSYREDDARNTYVKGVPVGAHAR